MASRGWMSFNATQSYTQHSEQTPYYNPTLSIRTQQEQQFLKHQGPETSVDLLKGHDVSILQQNTPGSLHVAGSGPWRQHLIPAASYGSPSTLSLHQQMLEMELELEKIKDPNHPADFDFIPDLEQFPEDLAKDEEPFLELPYQSWPKVGPPDQRYHDRKCMQCPMIFPRKCDMKKHMLKHTKPYKCPEPGCDAASSEKRGLDRHMKSCHRSSVKKEDLVKCPYCEYAYTRSDTVQRHAWTIHGNRISFKPTGASPTATSASKGAKS